MPKSVGVAVGSGRSGGLLVRNVFTGRVTEEFQSSEDGVRLSRGGGGGGRRGRGGDQLLMDQQEALRRDAEERARREAERVAKQAQERAAEQARQEKIRSQTSAGQLLKSQSKANVSEPVGFGGFINEKGFVPGFATSQGTFYPTRNPEFVPSGYVKGSIAGFDPSRGSFSIVAPIGYGQTSTVTNMTDMGASPSSSQSLFGARSIRPVPTISQSYKSYLKNRNPITGTLSFIGEKIQGKFDVVELRYAPRGQSLASTGLVSTTVQTAPYFVPGIGAYLAGASGIGQLATGGGIAEIKQASTIGKVALVGGSVLGVTAGSVQAYSTTSKALGFPRYSTTFVSKTAQDGGIIDALAVTKEQRLLFRDRTYATASRTIFRRGEFDTFGAGTTGRIAQKSGRKYKPYEDFSSFSFGDIRQGTFNLPVTSGQGFQVFKPIEDAALFRALGGSSVGGRQPKPFASMGASLKGEGFTYSFARTVPFSRSKPLSYGRGLTRGITLPEQQATQLFSRGSVSATRGGSVSEEIIKGNIQSAIQSQASTGITSFSSVASPSSSLLSRSTSIYAGTGLYERTDTMALSRISNRQKPSSTLGLSFINLQDTRQRSGLSLIPAQAQVIRTRQGSSTGLGSLNIQSTAQGSRLITTQTTTQIPRYTPPPFPRLTPVPLTPRIPFSYLGIASGRRIGSSLLGRFSPRYAPSLTAISFNLRGVVPKRFRGGVVDPFGTRVIPLRRRRKKRRK